MLLFFLSYFFQVLSYNYSNHGSDWPLLCNTSLSQSPVSINPALAIQVPSSDANYWYLDLYYTPLHVINLNSTSIVQVTSGFAFNPSISFNILGNFGNVTAKYSGSSKTYISSGITFHYPAEHTFNGVAPGNSPYLLEVQIEHVNAELSTDILILSILFQESSQKSSFLQQVIDSYYSNIGGDIDCTFATGGWYVIKNFFMYLGSETRPNCNEGVTWVINMDIGNATQEQINFFATKLNTTNYNGNFRYTMPLNGRTISQFTSEIFSFSGFLLIFTGYYLII